MMPEFRLRDRVLIDPKVEAVPGDFVVVQNGQQADIVLRKYKYRGKDSHGKMIYELTPLNDVFPTLNSDVENLTLIGVLIEHRKKYKTGLAIKKNSKQAAPDEK
jgi:SOS-response transcriptional repressor LexA